MGKDPAVLFYTSDFLSGTLFFSDDQCGKYIRLLCMQHQSGRIPKSYMSKFLDDGLLMSKFLEDENGYYNPRMEEESIKRSEYCKSRAENKAKNKNQAVTEKKASYVKHMSLHMENENRNGIGISISSLKSPEKLSSFQVRHAEFLTAGPPEWMNFDYASGKAWAVAFADNPTLDPTVLIVAAGKYRIYCDRTSTMGNYVKHPDNWIKDGGWSVDWEKKLSQDIDSKNCKKSNVSQSESERIKKKYAELI